jgi:3-oxoacyl-[acyl-carrier-protein] synthase II
MTAPRPDGQQAARAMREAMARRGIEPEEIEYVNAHGSSTPLNDGTESRVIRDVFGEHADRLSRERHQGLPRPLRSAPPARSKRHHRARHSPRLDPTYPEPRDARSRVRPPLHHGRGRTGNVRYAISNSFGFGGINAALVFAAPDERGGNGAGSARDHPIPEGRGNQSESTSLLGDVRAEAPGGPDRPLGRR